VCVCVCVHASHRSESTEGGSSNSEGCGQKSLTGRATRIVAVTSFVAKKIVAATSLVASMSIEDKSYLYILYIENTFYRY
jgi:hypothetical protein